MKKVISLILVVLILTGCTNGFPNGVVRQPEGKVILDDEHYAMIQSNYEWAEKNVHITQASSTPEELVDEFETLVAEKGDTLKFKIDKNPTSITVTKLNEDGTIDSVEIEDNKITLPSKGGYYIYELNTTWVQGKENFTFDINVK